jgi:hypothetical protein
MASPSIVQNTVGRNPVTNQGSPTTSITNAAATWRGRSPMTTVPYPQVPGLMWQGKGQGRFSLIETVPPKDVRFARGPRLVPQRGTLDAWVRGPTNDGVRYFLQLGPERTTDSTSFISIGVAAGSKTPFFGIMDKDLSIVGVIVAASLPELVAGKLHHIEFSWDAAAGTIAARVDGTDVPPGDFTTDPGGTPWDPGVPVEAWLSKETWERDIELVQVSSNYIL